MHLLLSAEQPVTKGKGRRKESGVEVERVMVVMDVTYMCINTLTDEAVYRRHEISSVMSDFRQCPWEIGSAPAERAGQGEVGGCTRRVQTAWRCLGLALKSPWLEPSGPLLSSFAWRCLGLALKSPWLEPSGPLLSSFAQMG